MAVYVLANMNGMLISYVRHWASVCFLPELPFFKRLTSYYKNALHEDYLDKLNDAL